MKEENFLFFLFVLPVDVYLTSNTLFGPIVKAQYLVRIEYEHYYKVNSEQCEIYRIGLRSFDVSDTSVLVNNSIVSHF